MKPLSDSVLAHLQSDLQTPDLIGTRYTIVRYLARGGMGSIWLAEDTTLNRRVALKVLDAIAPDDLPARLLQEARILAGLEHPGIVPVHDAGTLPDGRAFYCMKYVEGQTLAKHISGKTLPDRLRLLERIAEPIDFAHAHGYIHRDLKPENIMIGNFGEVLVMDWGLAKITIHQEEPCRDSRRFKPALSKRSAPKGLSSRAKLDGPSTQASILGTPGYMSPEQSAGCKTDHRSDIFSLGAILTFLLNDQPNPIPRPLQAIAEKAKSPDPNTRYQSASEMTSDIAHYLNGEPVSAYPEGPLERAARLLARHRTAVVLVAAYLLMRLIFILLSRR
jgi:serine/threonine protein kinase